MANLYELERALAEFELEIDEETGEILNADELDALQMERDIKIENIALWIKNLKADAEAYKKEKESFYKKERVAKNKAERLKNYLEYVLDGERFKTDRVTISYRKSAAVEISDPGAIPGEYMRVKAEPDKTRIKEGLKGGDKIPGAALVEKMSIQIK